MNEQGATVRQNQKGDQGLFNWSEDGWAEKPGRPIVDEPENWRGIDGYPGYDVSDLGRVRSWWKRGYRKGRIGVERISSDTPSYLKASANKLGYSYVNLYPISGKPKGFRIMSLVLTAFVGPKPVGMVGCHDPDPDGSNNRLSNLRWASKRDNAIDYLKQDASRKLVIGSADVPNIWNDLIDGESVADIARKYRVNRSVITNIKFKRSWSHITDALPGIPANIGFRDDNREAVRIPPEISECSEELWANIPGWSAYRVSNRGRFQSRWMAYKGKGSKLGDQWRMIPLSLARVGYYYAMLVDPVSGKRQEPLHRLILLAFAGPCPAGMEGCHLDDDRTNNDASNLVWDTRSANQKQRRSRNR